MEESTFSDLTEALYFEMIITVVLMCRTQFTDKNFPLGPEHTTSTSVSYYVQCQMSQEHFLLLHKSSKYRVPCVPDDF